MANNPTPKTFTYHVFKNGAFKGTLNNVISDFAYQEEINSAGSTITITLGVAADNYGEGTLIDFNNEIDVYVIDDENPNGAIIFKGFIVNYQPFFTDTNQEQVVLTVMGYGATLNDYILESAVTPDVNQNSQNGNILTLYASSTGSGFSVVQSFLVGAGVTRLSSIAFWMAAATPESVGQSVLLQIFSAQSDAEYGGLSSLVGSVSMPMSSLTAGQVNFVFGTALTVTSGNTYWARLSMPNAQGAFDPGFWSANVYYDSTAPYPSGILETLTNTGLSYSKATIAGDAYIITFQSAGITQFSFNSVDPSAILRAVMDNYIAQGGRISYTGASIDTTNTVVSYQFNANTIFEAINKCLSLAPVGWYFYIDQINNVLHFHKVGSTPTHTLAMAKNIKNLSVEKRAQDIINVVYFVGGPVTGINLYQKYILQTSIDLYGRHAIRYSDSNVTLAATAQIIANSILSNQGQAALRIEMDILDNAGDANSILGFNIESLTLGESISFRSLGAGSGGTLWDQAKWDISKWDFDITDLSSIIVQVTRIDYTPNILHLSLSTIPPDITKRVQDIYRNLTQLNTLNNPAAPS